MIPQSQQVLLFYEARFPQAFLSTDEYVNNGSPFGGPPKEVVGANGKLGSFAVSFADGHAGQVQCRMKGSMFKPNEFTQYPAWQQQVMIRGPGWQYDCFPEELIKEHFGCPDRPYDP